MLKVIGWYILASAMAHSAYCRLVFKDCPKDISVITGFEAQKVSPAASEPDPDFSQEKKYLSLMKFLMFDFSNISSIHST